MLESKQSLHNITSTSTGFKHKKTNKHALLSTPISELAPSNTKDS